MDKRQRKQLAQWESKKAKTQSKFEERVREHFEEPALVKIEAFGDSYKPHPVRVLPGVIKQAETYLKELRQPLPPPGLHQLMMSRSPAAEWILMGEDDFGWMYRMMNSSTRYFGRRLFTEYDQFIVHDDRRLDRRIDVPKTIDAIRDHKDNQLRRTYMREIMRSALRLDPIREELAVAVHKSRTIHNCKSIKEDLMAAVWHPRRVEHILENYGWEAYENLLGE
jgi:hypothetical protein